MCRNVPSVPGVRNEPTAAIEARNREKRHARHHVDGHRRRIVRHGVRYDHGAGAAVLLTQVPEAGALFGLIAMSDALLARPRRARTQVPFRTSPRGRFTDRVTAHTPMTQRS